MEFRQLKLDQQSRKNSLIFLLPISFLILVGVGVFIASSFYEVDYLIVDILYQSMSYKFFRFWETFTTINGYIAVLTTIFLMVLIIFESLVFNMFQVKPTTWLAKVRDHRFLVYFVTFIILFCLEETILGLTCFKNKGFGSGFDPFLLVGLSYLVPTFFLSTILQCFYFWFISWVMLTKVGKDGLSLLSEGYAKRCVNLLLMLIFSYVLILIFKPGFARPYYFNVNWATIFTNDFNLTDEKRLFYLNQTDFNYGFILYHSQSQFLNQAISNIPEIFEFPWYQAHGWFGDSFIQQSGISGYLPWSDAFPSGHTSATIYVGSLVYVFAKPNLKIQKNRKYILIGFALAILYLLDMSFALVSSAGHWMSDVTFQYFMMPFWFIISYLITYKVIFHKKKRR